MVAITLPDGSVRQYEGPVSGADIAADIGPGLAKAALAVRVDGELTDLLAPIENDACIGIITSKDDDALGLLRHDCAHVMAEAVKELYPETQVTIGPNIEDGFYYDFSRTKPFTPEDLEKIEARMREIVKRDEAITREVWDRGEAILFFKDAGEHYKAEIIEAIPKDESIGLYRQGDFIDLCRGPHFPSTGKIGRGFKLMKLAGAYWRGDSRNEMLQRIYGTAWFSEKDLKAYLHRLEEAEKRDHRRLGREMSLFHLQEEAAGSVFWHDKGWTLYRTIESYIRSRLAQAGYIEVNTPQLVDRSLWEESGHWEKFRENMFTAESEEKILALKPMNCPCHVQIFRQGIKSYRDLPLRMAEFGCCHRNEPSGALHGLMRVRAFIQDDAHIFCTEDQITGETKAFCGLLLSVYKDFGFTDVSVRFSDRPELRAGDDAVWDRAEAALQQAVVAAGLEFTLDPGEGAFYGPKLDFVLQDAIGREWQCGTLQVDFVLPERLDASYVGEDGGKHRPVMLHRAILGSLERFIGVLIEHYAGKFPLWLAPLQAIVATITSDADAYAVRVAEEIKRVGLRVETDLRNEKINYKVREHSHAKVPVVLVLGKQEAEKETVALRRLDGEKQEILALDEAVNRLASEAVFPPPS
ncbi:MAG: threonine--tRNA ligase [Alphaproteobacteria bacterium]|jgi:threonyl-tRNA synthetase|nr:threonine--tRNA ligase [Alphaproteobacteria bacterium]MDP6660534.1 threonine--tRNA ligase [Alphaproteobacteria bacterium]MDP6780577.1 threonine--tRNA ligase [Alphaproteobacteria bacterium]MDP7044754.1 threonine--tRNA ligase [Alphaproteobacteria bacterium]